MRTTLIGRLLAALVACAAGPALGETVLRLSEPAGPGGPEAAALAVFRDEVAARSAGRLRIEVRLQDELGGLAAPVDGLAAGPIDLYTGPLATFRHLAPAELAPLSLPWLLQDEAQLRRFLAGPVFQRAERRLREHGIRLVSTAFTGLHAPVRVIVATRRLTAADDLSGLRVRVAADDLAQRSWRAVGAAPMALPWSETYLALRRRAAEAAELPLGELRAARFAAVAPFVATAGLAPRLWPMVIGERRWAALPAADRAVLVAAADAAGRIYSRVAEDAARHELAAMTSRATSGPVRLDTTVLRRRLDPLWHDLVTRGALAPEMMEIMAAQAP
ncbi:TRAP transporter substrate-binding protein DctP [Rhodoplanes sp. TEM]|uniref:TRAP transporter substrate-binding protein DctP n=1 Tax=Rhodoplanes tepidamans TaxID=200616 RepID=A0ABT5J9G5_RHOTP|nr:MULTISPECIES: TRAP transporter substrate-binding protein DctP [Rhodoplanes]MDC7785929.1 TRAP transporter substrate-binding protein DctP [Rhodoplanes tepidamans]MDC7987519.1 TRAP transporter substrate-binding protein DctP [Rhodoplanes sp. TEM]MDQ0355452.1 C4-dicarboxylate-binding protein DctP [Rhodoplanes tepidamans]